MNHDASTRELVIDGGALALHVLKTMTTAHKTGARCSLDDLVAALRVRRIDVRRVLSALHEEGMLDVTRMQLTLEGFAVGSALQHSQLAPLRVRLRPLAKARHAA